MLCSPTDVIGRTVKIAQQKTYPRLFSIQNHQEA